MLLQLVHKKQRRDVMCDELALDQPAKSLLLRRETMGAVLYNSFLYCKEQKQFFLQAMCSIVLEK